MKLTFSIDYRTKWGESVYLMGNIKELGGNIDAKAVKMAFDGESRWSVTIALPETTESFTYGYIVRNEQGTARTEWWGQRTFTAVEGVSDYELIDSWQEFPLIAKRHNPHIGHSNHPTKHLCNIEHG